MRAVMVLGLAEPRDGLEELLGLALARDVHLQGPPQCTSRHARKTKKKKQKKKKEKRKKEEEKKK